MAGHGGARPGAGRKPKAQKNETAIARAEQQIRDRLPEVIDALFDLALGVKVEDVNILTGEAVVYRRPPDRAAAQYLTDRIMGKPTERQEISGPDGTPLFKVVEASDDFNPDAA